MIKYIIVDDEPIAHEIIKGYCNVLPKLSFVQHCYDAIEAMEYLKNNEVDLVFLDLNMPKLKGFDFLKILQNPPKVIVTTAYQEFALEGYELNIVDYLLKPFSFERFIKAVNKVDVSDKETSPTSNVKKKEQSLFLRSNKKHVQVKYEDILFVEATGNYIKVVTSDKEIQVREKISDIMNLLPEEEFFQVHKSFIVAKQCINEIEGNRIFINDFVIPIGKVYKNNLKRLFE
ncbi:DNA-binding response regulator, LytR/AlgR family [Tenacibaculum sp. MAR_2009_124]|uniref:LytR/AlgR family response regulator transcription factor n=1 Tax=Tenacibaculum sp. MAR_2009_124 TaxID=1250059 RepID=UPI00089D6FA3|nr:LytTR family DNA-binding domain-containing protein [Tenacibaculum sp. MAR_2009_124]SEB46586.1 DNA-binding response regulator, LytR/AlgR family [Tenacibaculum sp. MAR_2009_124]